MLDWLLRHSNHGIAVKHSQIRQLEDLGQRAWPASRVDESKGWRLSFDAGVTRRANSILPLGWNEDESLDGALERCEARYRALGLTPRFKLTAAARPRGLARRLEDRGYREEGQSRVLTAATRVLRRPNRTAEVQVVTADKISETWCSAALPYPAESIDYQARRGIVERIAAVKVFVLAHIDGMPAGAALAVAEASWTCITSVHTLAAFRRRGVAQALLDRLFDWAEAQGAGNLYIQVESDNRPAFELYRRLGFEPAYSYRYATLA